ncbi:MAG: L-serine ammonia-lyase [Corynebacterium sp.]|nr:L-serine ammonia-lyase [Corynebacterium sp.]
MTISAIDMFSIGVGPSSSHTVGPMRAANAFATTYGEQIYTPGAQVRITLYGSLAATGVGHGTDRAAIVGLVGYTPTSITPDIAPVFGATIETQGSISGPAGSVRYELIFNFEALRAHPNALTFELLIDDAVCAAQTYYSVGGGFILDSEAMDAQQAEGELGAGVSTRGHNVDVPYPFTTGTELLRRCTDHNLSIPTVMAANEAALYADHGPQAPSYALEYLDEVWATMRRTVTAGIATTGQLPGGLGVMRRAPQLYASLITEADSGTQDALWGMEWVNLYALAVNEENAAGGRIVTAPTNGAAGIIPAVLHYARDFTAGFHSHSHRNFLLTAAAIGIIIKENASISGAEVGCQGEVGSAAAMAAAGLCQILGGSPAEVEHAAEIALEHNLGLTCDPVGGLVQIPCIERNAIGAVKAINAARMSMRNTSPHHVSLDDVVETMAQTGRDMLTKYKETSTGGLAIQLGLPVNITEC